MRITNLNIIFFVLFFGSTFSVQAQLGFCTSGSNPPIFTEDFGTGNTRGSLPTANTDNVFQNTGKPGDGQYALSHTTDLDPAPLGWHALNDHTSGDTDGRSLVVNADFVTDRVFYTTEINGLCGNTEYELSAWIVNILEPFRCGFNPERPINVGFKAETTTAVTLAEGETGYKYAEFLPLWEKFGLTFVTNPGQTSVIIKLINKALGGCGNDLAIDDIQLKRCGSAMNMPTFSQVPPICIGDLLSPLPTTSNEGITGTWSPAIDNIATKTYTFTPTNTSCASANTMTIAVNPLKSPTFNPVAPICAGDFLSPLPTTSNEGITGTWSPAFNNMVTTTYSFTPNAGQCATSQTLTVVVSSLGVPTFNVVAPICAGDFLSPLPTTSNEGITGTWSPALNNMVTTTYSFTPNAGQCATSQTLTIVVSSLSVPTFNPVAPICAGDFLSPLPTTSNEGITGTWSPALNNMVTTTYSFTPNTGQCATSQTLTVVVSSLSVPTFNVVAPICAGDFLSPLPTTSNEGITGTWSPALNNMVTTTYSFTPNTGQCAASQTLIITVNTLPVVPTFNLVAEICTGDLLSPLPTTSNEGITGTWSPALDNTLTTTYSFTPNAGQCATSQTLTVAVSSLRVPTFTPVASICTGDLLSPLPTTSNEGITGTWSPALDNTLTTTYSFTPNPGQCATKQVLTVTVNSSAVVPTFNPVASICAGDVLSPLPTISNEGISGTWSPVLNNINSGSYTFTPTGAACASEGSLNITVYNLPTINANDVSITRYSNNTRIIINTSELGNAYALQPAGVSTISYQSLPLFDNIRSGAYTLFVRNICGVIRIPVFVPLSVLELDIPKYFSPNGDGQKDFWLIKNLRELGTANNLISIFDRQGKLLKKMSPFSQGWDGTYNGAPMPRTDYWFKIALDDGKEIIGHFSLFR